MPQYAILRFAKQKGGAGALEAHHERTKEKYASNPDIDTTKSKYNFHIVQPSTTYRKEVDSRIATAGCKTRKDSVRFIDTLITASPEFFKGKNREQVRIMFQTATNFLEEKIGEKNIFSAIVHMDERTPHLHLCFTPITDDGRLSAKDIIGNRTQLTKWQDEFWSHMVKAFPGLERGESASVTGRKHIPTRVFKQAIHLTKDAERIQEILGGINPLNASKKRDEAVTLIKTFLPKAENFFTVLTRYKNEFERQERVNKSLRQKIEDSKPSMKEQLEAYDLKRNYERLKKMYNAIPEDIRREAIQARKPREIDSDRGGR